MFGVHPLGSSYFGQGLGNGEIDFGEPAIAIEVVDVAADDRMIVVGADDRVFDVPVRNQEVTV